MSKPTFIEFTSTKDGNLQLLNVAQIKCVVAHPDEVRIYVPGPDDDYYMPTHTYEELIEILQAAGVHVHRLQDQPAEVAELKARPDLMPLQSFEGIQPGDQLRWVGPSCSYPYMWGVIYSVAQRDEYTEEEQWILNNPFDVALAAQLGGDYHHPQLKAICPSNWALYRLANGDYYNGQSHPAHKSADQPQEGGE